MAKEYPIYAKLSRQKVLQLEGDYFDWELDDIDDIDYGFNGQNLMDKNLEVKAVEAIQEIYKDTLFKKAIACIEASYPNTGEYVLRQLETGFIIVGYLTYYTEEAVLTPYSEQLGLTEADIGEPCEYWEMVLAIDDNGSVYECQAGNNSPDKHPEWERISKTM